uniref:Palmitoyltransferase n=1 Tax=Neobodo designis TaxID=312471 RepID=A0A7S1M644_NEODS|mmetsp:Transcript_34746/g.107299  ORF Transcript_34746/g.107299 Transcript_34746/m.107299 type:complete len:311 (+) Transcript_34746:70-1002(+)
MSENADAEHRSGVGSGALGAFEPNQQRNVPKPPSAPRPDRDSLGNTSRFFGGVLAADSVRLIYCIVALLFATLAYTYLWSTTPSKATPWFVVATWLLLFVNLFVLVRTATLNPGIAPKATHPRPSVEDRAAGRDYQYVRVKRLTVPMPYCYTCELVREPRMSHCAVCDNCVRRFDHHCTFIGACIGAGNFGHFYALLVASTLSMGFVIGTLTFYIIHWWNTADGGNQIIAGLLICGASFIFLNTSLMTGTYTHLIVIGHTFREDVKRRGLPNPSQAYNPFDNGCWANFKEMVLYQDPPFASEEASLLGRV